MTKLPTPTEDNAGSGGGGAFSPVVKSIRSALTLKIVIVIAAVAIVATILCAVI
jgi:hypothetical protein